MGTDSKKMKRGRVTIKETKKRLVVCPAVKYELDKEGENLVNDIH